MRISLFFTQFNLMNLLFLLFIHKIDCFFCEVKRCQMIYHSVIDLAHKIDIFPCIASPNKQHITQWCFEFQLNEIQYTRATTSISFNIICVFTIASTCLYFIVTFFICLAFALLLLLLLSSRTLHTRLILNYMASVAKVAYSWKCNDIIYWILNDIFLFANVNFFPTKIFH